MYKLMPLNYEYNALEPYISAFTINIHYNKHYQKYLKKLNDTLNSLKYDYRYNLVDLITHIDEFPLADRDTILYNAGGVLNHELYFSNISPNKNNQPTGKLKEAIDKKYGSFDNFKNEFIKTSGYLTGSGYTFLVLNKNELDIINTSNQDTPYLYDLIPIMSLDLWEHAYYLDYQNDKENYILNFFEIVDFEVIGKLYEENTQKNTLQ